MKVRRSCMQTTMDMFVNGANVGGVGKLGCLLCWVQVHMCRLYDYNKLHGFGKIIILPCAFSVYSTQTVHIM